MMEVDFPPSPHAPSTGAKDDSLGETSGEPQLSAVGVPPPARSTGEEVGVEDVTPVPSPSAANADEPMASERQGESYGDFTAAETQISAAVSTAENSISAEAQTAGNSLPASAAGNAIPAGRFVADVPDYIPGMTATHRPYPQLLFDISEGQVVAAVINHPGRNEREIFQRLICDYGLEQRS